MVLEAMSLAATLPQLPLPTTVTLFLRGAASSVFWVTQAAAASCGAIEEEEERKREKNEEG